MLNLKKLKGFACVFTAASHNKRAPADRGDRSNVDSSRTHLNECLAGPPTPHDVAALARREMESCKVGKLRKDAVRALEIVVSLPAGHDIDESVFFRAAVAWIEDRFGGCRNLLSADVHRDEAAPHIHVLVVPLVNGRMNGSAMVGGHLKLRALQRDFHAQVSAQFGMQAPIEPLDKRTKAAVSVAVLSQLRETNDPALRSLIWPVFEARIQRDPIPFAKALGITWSDDKRNAAGGSTDEGPDVANKRMANARRLDEAFAL